MDATNAELAEYLGVSDSTVSKWLKTTGSRAVYANSTSRR
jgi:excisionase family DNA binding protein